MSRLCKGFLCLHIDVVKCSKHLRGEKYISFRRPLLTLPCTTHSPNYEPLAVAHWHWLKSDVAVLGQATDSKFTTGLSPKTSFCAIMSKW